MRTLIFWIMVFPFTHAFSQEKCTGILSGSVISESGEKLIGATIQLNDGRGAIADTNGNFRMEKICPGRYTVTVQFVGYETIRLNVTSPTNEVQKIVLKQESLNLQEVVIQEQVKNTEHNQNVSQLTSQQLAEFSGKTLGETLKEISGVNSIQSGPGVFKPVIHGVHSQRILILNHGIRQEGQQWGAEHAPEIDPFVASNIAVVKDASAIKYGTDALGGVIIVNPAELPDKSGLGGAIHAVAQSNGRSATLSGMLEGGIKNHEGWGWRIQSTAKQAGDFHTPNYNLTNTGVRELNFSSAVGLHRERFGWELYYSRFQSKIGILKGTSISNLDDLVTAMESSTPQFTTDFSYSIQEPRQEVSHDLIKLNGHLKTARGEIRFQYGFQNNHRQEFDIRRGSLSSLPSINLKLSTHSIETEWEQQRENRMTCIGFTGMFQINNNIPGTQRIPFIPNFTGISSGIFAIGKFTWNKVTLDAGGRYDLRYYDVTGFDFKNARYQADMTFHNASLTAGATLKLSARSRFSTNVSSAWRPPHVAELYSVGTHQSAAAIEYGLLLNDQTNEVMDIQDVDFNVEQALKWVSTYRYEREQYRVEATAYANHIFNYIYLRPMGVTQNVRGVYPYFRYTQTDALFLGADVSIEADLSRQWQWNAKASLLRASDETNNDYLVFIPSNRIEGTLRYHREKVLGLPHFYAEVKVKHVMQQNRAPQTISVREIKEAQEQNLSIFSDGRNFDFADAPDSYTLVSSALGFSLPTGKSKLDFRAAADNLMNITYREYTNRFRYYADEMGRNFIISIKYTF